MKQHQEKFYEIETLLRLKLGNRVVIEKEEDKMFLYIQGNDFWLSTDDTEFTVGYGMNHTHFSQDYNNLSEGISHVFDLLTNDVRKTLYKKGERIYKVITEIKYSDSRFINIGTSTFLTFSFWKKTKTEIHYLSKVIEKSEIENDIKRILE